MLYLIFSCIYVITDADIMSYGNFFTENVHHDGLAYFEPNIAARESSGRRHAMI